MDKLQEKLQSLFNLLEQNFFLSREFNKVFVSQQVAENLTIEKQYKELAIKLLDFILTIHKSNQQSALQERIAQTQKLLINYQAQVCQSQKKESNELQQVLSYKSNPITPRQGQMNLSKSQSSLVDKRLKSNQSQSTYQAAPKNTNNKNPLFIENVPKMGKPQQIKDGQQRNYNIITGV